MTIPVPMPESPDHLEHRRRGFWPSAERQANTVFLFFLNPVLDPDTDRISGTRLLAWIIVWADVFDIIHNHSLQELRLALPNKTAIDALDWHNVATFALAFLIWFGPKGMEWGVQLVSAWKGNKPAAG